MKNRTRTLSVLLLCALLSSCAGLPFHLALEDRVTKLEKRVQELERKR